MSFLYGFLVIIVMLVLNAIFAAYEMALASMSLARLHVLAGKKVKGASEALFMKMHMEASLAVVQLGITLVGAIAAATGGLSVADKMAPYLVSRFSVPDVLANIISVACFVLPLSAVTIIFAELVPKMIAINNRERVCLALSSGMKTLFHLLNPVVRIFEMVVKWVVAKGTSRLGGKKLDDSSHLHELRAAAALARTSSLIGAHQERIVVAAAQLSSRPVKEIIIPIADVSTIPASASLSQALVRAHMDMHTRFPVCAKEGDVQTIEGYVNFKDIIAALRLSPSDPSVKGIVRPIRSVHAEIPIAQALETMMQDNLHIMLVALKNGRIVGLVTLEDIIEELVGEIEDEFDRLPTYIHPYAGGWIVGGGILMSSLSQAVGRPLVVTDPQERLSGWCIRHGGGALEGGQEIVADGLKLTIRKFRRRKVSEASIALA